MELIFWPNVLLNQVCTTVEIITPEIKQQCIDMQKLLKEHKALGLAASQVGILNRIIVIDTKDVDSENGFKGVLINPVIQQQSFLKVEIPDRCLSFPNEEVKVNRPIEVWIKYKTINNKIKFELFRGISARVIQHEISHLDGITIDNYRDLNEKK